MPRAPKPPPIGRLRLANVDDAPIILDLITESVAETFRVQCSNDIIYLIENAILSICQLDTCESIIGFVAARDYPVIPSVHPSSWETFIWTKYKAIEMNARNTMFLHLLCWNPAYSRELVDNMLKSIFTHDPFIHHIAMVKSLPQYPLLVPGQFRAESSFRRLTVNERGASGDKLPVLLVADRTEISPRLRVRRAVEEDNDDIVPIIDNHSERLRELYGEFYISELISRHPESDRVLLVCEHKELAVGIMCLNTTVNYESLEESYILAPFGGLRQLDKEPSLPRAESNVSSYSYMLDPDHCWKPSAVKVPTEDGVQPTRPAETEPEDVLPMITFTPLSILDFLLEEDEEELEFDIINIDTELLRVPEVLCTKLSPTAEAIEGILGDLSPNKEPVTKESTYKRSAPVPPMDHLPEPVRFKGAPNAFLIEIFAIHPDYDERYGFDILEAAYELFPNRDYCIISLPSNQPPFPLLENFTLVTPIGTRMRFINESLYVAHVNSIRGDLKVRWGEHYDTTALESITENAPRCATLMNLYNSTLGSKTLESFVFLSENQPIGMVVIGPLEDGTAVRTQYDLEPEPRRPGTDGAILAGILSPAFEPHTRWFLREIMRQSRYSTFFWLCRLFAKGDSSPSRNLMSLASHMNPVHPRRTAPNISGNKELDSMYKHISCPYALWMLEKPMTSLPKVHVNNNIVVVGASRVGLAFLETLLMGPTSQYLTFSNLTLVSENGLPTVTDCLKAADICVPRVGRFSDRYIKSTPFYFYVDVINAVMVGIDRKRKCIHLKNGSTKYYDELVLTCGQQFQHPEYLQDALNLVKEVQEGYPCERILMDNPKYKEDRVPLPPELPSNVFLVNSLFEANIILRKLMRMITDIKGTHALSCTNQVVVYGDCNHAYSCIAALLELGIQAKLITFVEPFPSEDPTKLRVNCFNDETIDEKVQNKLKDLGIRVMRRCHLDGWRQVGDCVESLNLMSPLHASSINCFALFYYGIRAINLHAFKAINESGLVYDGGLVVSPTFETNDPNIYGAGPCVSYSRKLYATRRFHRNYCSEDIGEALAKLFLQRLDPFVTSEYDAGTMTSDLLPVCTSAILGFQPRSQCNFGSASSSRLRNEPSSTYRRWQPVMKFESPIIQSITLPGPMYYMKMRKPGPEVPMGVQQLLPHQGHTLITDKNGNYFYLRLNVLHVVEAVTCLCHEPFSYEILSQLFGKHEAAFNKLLERYLRNEIDDFYKFFTQPWMSALYQETFQELMDAINSQDVGTIHDLMKSKFALYEDRGLAKNRGSVYGTSQSLHCRDINDPGNMRDWRRVGTFRSVIEKYITRNTSSRTDGSSTVDIPLQCGQEEEKHNDANRMWERVSGEAIVSAHLARYLDRNSVTNPHYAKPLPENFQ